MTTNHLSPIIQCHIEQAVVGKPRPTEQRIGLRKFQMGENSSFPVIILISIIPDALILN